MRDQHVALEDLWGRAGTTIAAQCLETERDEQRLAILTDALQRRLAQADPFDPVGPGIASLLHDRPDRSVRALAGDMGLSERQLRRRVEEAVGYSPRTLARILRFQRFLAAARWDTLQTIRSFDPDWQTPAHGYRMSLAFRLDSPAEVDALYAALVDKGYEGHKAPWDAFWGMRYAVVHDPDGNGVDLFSPMP